MKICDITSFYHKKSGGVKTYLHEKINYISTLSDVKHILIVPGEYDEREIIGSTVVYKIKAPELPYGNGYRLIVNLKQVNAIVEDFRPDIIEVGCPYFLPWSLYARYKYGCRIAAFYHSDFPKAYAKAIEKHVGELSASIFKRCALSYVRSMYKRADIVFAPSEFAAASLNECNVKNTIVVPLGVNTDNFNPKNKSLEYRQKLGIPNECVLMLYVGRFSWEKGIDILQEAFERLEEKFTNRYYLLLVGDGPLKSSLLQWAKNHRNVKVCGYLEGKELATVYATADLFVTCGAVETFGLTVLEAQASGTPVIAVSSGAACKTVVPNAGIVVRNYNADALEKAILDISNTDLMEVGMMARKFVEVNYSWQKTFDKLFVHYQNLMQKENALSDNIEKKIVS